MGSQVAHKKVAARREEAEEVEVARIRQIDGFPAWAAINVCSPLMQNAGYLFMDPLNTDNKFRSKDAAPSWQSLAEILGKSRPLFSFVRGGEA